MGGGKATEFLCSATLPCLGGQKIVFAVFGNITHLGGLNLGFQRGIGQKAKARGIIYGIIRNDLSANSFLA